MPGGADFVTDWWDTAADLAANHRIRRFGLISIERLEARIKLRRRRGKALLRLSGHFSADVTQSCVVTLAPVPGGAEWMIRLGPRELSTREPMKCREFELSASGSPVMSIAPVWPLGVPQAEVNASTMRASQAFLNSIPKPAEPRIPVRVTAKSAQRWNVMPLLR